MAYGSQFEIRIIAGKLDMPYALRDVAHREPTEKEINFVLHKAMQMLVYLTYPEIGPLSSDEAILAAKEAFQRYSRLAEAIGKGEKIDLPEM